MKRLIPLVCLLLSAAASRCTAGWVVETGVEFTVSGDLNGDGAEDVAVVDKASGFVRGGLVLPGGITDFRADWSFSSGVHGVTSAVFGSAAFGQPSVAVANPDFNTVAVAAAGAIPDAFPVNGIGPRSLVMLASGDLVTVTSRNGAPENEQIESWFTQLPVPAGAVLERGNEAVPGTFAFLSRGTGGAGADELRVFPFIYTPAAPLTIPSGSEWIALRSQAGVAWFGVWQPGTDSLSLQSFDGTTFSSPPLNAVLPAAVSLLMPLANQDGLMRLLAIGSGGDSVWILEFDGTLPLATLQVLTVSAGEKFTAAIPLEDGFALLSAPEGESRSAFCRPYSPSSSGGYIPAGGKAVMTGVPDAARDRANFFAMTGEIFVVPGARFTAGLRAGDWTGSPTGLPPGVVDVMAEVFNGPDQGLGTPVPYSFPGLPLSSSYALTNQYMADISVASFATPAGRSTPVPVFNPPPGRYAVREVRGKGLPPDFLPVTITGDGLSDIRYRTSPGGSWQSYTQAIPVTADTVIEAWADQVFGRRSPIVTAAYSFGDGPPAPSGDLDLDGDGLGDAWEKTFAVTDPHGDADSDGATNREEHDAGTDPRDPASIPANTGGLVLFMERYFEPKTGEIIHLFWPDELLDAGLEISDDLIDWNAISNDISMEGGFFHWRIPAASLPQPRSFFRLVR